MCEPLGRALSYQSGRSEAGKQVQRYLDEAEKQVWRFLDEVALMQKAMGRLGVPVTSPERV